jgi:nicotinate phosphoribosyltransferase
LATSFDAPALSAVYKLVELNVKGERRYTAKYSPDKQTLPGAKQVFRYATRDVVGCAGECAPSGGYPEALLRPVILNGELAEPLPSATEARDYCAAALERVQRPGHRVEYSAELLRVSEEHRGHENGISRR